MIQAVINATGVEPISSAGKPESAMYDEALELARGEGAEPFTRDVCLAIGDRLDTDIEAGNRGGYDSLAVLTGVTNPRELMLAAPQLRPTYIAVDLRALAASQPMPEELAPHRWRCGGSEAYLADRASEQPAIEIGGDHDIDALRAACALAWSLGDAGTDLHAVALPTWEGLLRSA